MPLGTEVNVGPGDVVFDGVAVPLSFRFMSIVAKRLDGRRRHLYLTSVSHLGWPSRAMHLGGL